MSEFPALTLSRYTVLQLTASDNFRQTNCTVHYMQLTASDYLKYDILFYMQLAASDMRYYVLGEYSELFVLENWPLSVKLTKQTSYLPIVLPKKTFFYCNCNLKAKNKYIFSMRFEYSIWWWWWQESVRVVVTLLCRKR